MLKVMKTGRAVYNPLEEKEETQPKEKMESTAGAFSYDKYGQCPRCSQQMTKALILNNEQVLWCNTCRISQPEKES